MMWSKFENEEPKKNVGPVGIVKNLPACPECHTKPTLIEWTFNISNRKWKRYEKGALKKIKAERRSYLRCQCGRCVTHWIAPLYKEGTNNVHTVTLPARFRAAAYYACGIFVKPNINA